MTINPLFATDGYKLSHILQYPPKTELVFSTWTPRMSRDKRHGHVVVFGIQPAMIKLGEIWRQGFFNRSLAAIMREFTSMHLHFLMCKPPQEWVDAITYLHNLGYLPLEIKALPEGTLCPIKTPYLTIKNTDPNCAWLTNFVETFLSTELWLSATSATTAYYNRLMLNNWAQKTGLTAKDMNFVGHDFSMRGMQNLQSGMMSGAAHLLSFDGTETVSTFPYINKYYYTPIERLVVGTVPATEHSVMCAWGKDGEVDLFDWLLTVRFSEGILSVVSDTWDLWTVIGQYLPELKDKIMTRNGKLVIRPDSGIPEDILCGDPTAEKDTLQYKGVVEVLWDIFGGTKNEAGFKTLDSHIGVIYGDAMNYDRVDTILARLAAKGFAANNVVFGFGSYNYTYVTRDTYGFALKSTAVVVDGEYREIYKDPATDTGFKKSQKGFVIVNDDLTYTDGLDVTAYEGANNNLESVFINGNYLNEEGFQQIKARLWG